MYITLFLTSSQGKLTYAQSQKLPSDSGYFHENYVLKIHINRSVPHFKMNKYSEIIVIYKLVLDFVLLLLFALILLLLFAFETRSPL